MTLAALQDAVVSTQNPYLGGAICTLSAVVALLLLRFYRRTRDLLFLLFSISFFLQGIGRLATLFAVQSHLNPQEQPENLAQYYLVRLVAYGLIIVAIVHKNRSRTAGPSIRP